MARFVFRVPRRFKLAEMGHLDQEVFSMVFDYAHSLTTRWNKGEGLALAGAPGIGKTYALAALTRFYAHNYPIGKGRPGDYEFVTVYDLIDRLTVFEGSDPPWDDYRDQPWATTYGTVPWLVMNDMGKEYRGGKLEQQAAYKFGRLLRGRSERELVTHVTMNLDPKEVKGVYGESVSSLLAEMVRTFTVHGPDRRRRRAPER